MKCLCVLLLISGVTFAAETPKLATIEFQTRGVDRRLGSTLSDRFAVFLRKRGATVFSQKDIAAVLSLERQRQLLGCVDASSSCAAELGWRARCRHSRQWPSRENRQHHRGVGEARRYLQHADSILWQSHRQVRRRRLRRARGVGGRCDELAQCRCRDRAKRGAVSNTGVDFDRYWRWCSRSWSRVVHRVIDSHRYRERAGERVVDSLSGGRVGG